MLFRMTLVVMALYVVCCAAALGQPAATSARENPAEARPATGSQGPVSAAELMQRNGGSLLRASLAAAPDPAKARILQVSYLAVPEPEPRTLKKHDLLTIIIREESDYSSQGTTDLKREGNIDARLDEFVKLNLKNLEIEGGAIGATPPSIKGSAKRDFKGEATVDRSDSFTARLTAEVLDVKPNGTVAVQARKRIRADDEEQEFILTGVIRAADVTVDNTVLSTQIHDLTLQKNHKGAVKDHTQRGWLVKLLDVLNPF